MTFDTIESAPALMNAHGYNTGVIGKVHVGPNHVCPWQSRQESDTRDVAQIADQVGSFLDATCNGSGMEKQPFFLTVGFIDPHRDRTRDGFGNNTTFDPRVQRVYVDPATISVPSFLNDTPGTRYELASYYGSINRLDQGVGMMLAQLEQRGLAEDTLVLFVIDNGPPFINSKTTLYDAGINLPFIVRCPGAAAGVTNPNMISYVDVLPNIVLACLILYCYLL